MAAGLLSHKHVQPSEAPVHRTQESGLAEFATGTTVCSLQQPQPPAKPWGGLDPRPPGRPRASTCT